MESDDDLLNSRDVRKANGNISDMTLWRWIRDGIIPSPDEVINGRRYWQRKNAKAKSAEPLR